MHHAITVGGLLLSIGVVAGLLGSLFGALMVFAGGMSDAPGDGDATSKSGCAVFIVSIVMLVGCLGGLVL